MRIDTSVLLSNTRLILLLVVLLVVSSKPCLSEGLSAGIVDFDAAGAARADSGRVDLGEVFFVFFTLLVVGLAVGFRIFVFVVVEVVFVLIRSGVVCGGAFGAFLACGSVVLSTVGACVSMGELRSISINVHTSSPSSSSPSSSVYEWSSLPAAAAASSASVAVRLPLPLASGAAGASASATATALCVDKHHY